MSNSDKEIQLDFKRAERIGLDETVLCLGKTDEHLASIASQFDARGTPALFTRFQASQYNAMPDALRAKFTYEPVARIGVFGSQRPLREGPSRIAVVCAGTSDTPVAREAEWTLRFHGEPCTRMSDVGIAGLWRLMDRVEELRKHPIVIVCAGMDAALPTAVGGLVPGLVIAVPTSVGYGVAAGGESALRSTLASCAQGVVVCNIDNGFGAACAALRAVRMLAQPAT